MVLDESFSQKFPKIGHIIISFFALLTKTNIASWETFASTQNKKRKRKKVDAVKCLSYVCLLVVFSHFVVCHQPFLEVCLPKGGFEGFEVNDFQIPTT